VSATRVRPARRQNAGPTRLERSEITRAALVRSASRLICELGMDGASIDRIAADAGYTKGAFYVHWDSKEDMFLTLLDEHFDAGLASLDAVLEGTGDPAAEARAAAEGFLARAESEPEWRGLYLQLAGHAARNSAFAERFAARQRDLRERMAEVFARWAADLGAKPALPARDVAAIVMSMADGFLLARIIDPTLEEGLYGTMFEVFLHGLMAMPGESSSSA
jgi:AcrR family transcriptional regulator